LSDGDTGVAGELFIEMVEAERYEEALGVSASASRAEATAAFIRLSGRYSGQDRVLIALNKARSAMLSETEVQKGVRLSRLKYLDKLRRHEEELASYDRALAIDPEDSTAWYNKGRTLSQLGRHEEALDAHDRALAIDPFDSATWFQKGLTLYELGRHEEALGPYDCALDIDPDDSATWFQKGLTLDKLGRHEEELASYDRALTIDPEDSNVWFIKGVTLVQLGRHEDALEAYDRALAINPDDSTTWFQKGLTLYELGRHEDALEAYDRALAIDPDDSATWFQKGLTLDKLLQHQEALEAYDCVLAIDAGYRNVWHDKGRTLSQLGQHEDALEAYDRALATDPNNSAASYDKGLVLKKLGRHQEALQAFDRVLAIDPSNSIAWHNKGLALGQLGRHQEALEAFNRALAVDPSSNSTAWHNKGCALNQLGRNKEALEAYDRVLAIDAGYRNAWCNKARTLSQLGQHEDALEAYNRALAIDPEDSTAWYNKGRTLSQLGRHEEELAAYERALAIDPSSGLASNARKLLEERIALSESPPVASPAGAVHPGTHPKQYSVLRDGCNLEIRVSDLPEMSKTRLQAALKKPPQGTFVISESKFGWASIGLVVSLLGLWGVVAAADNYKWQSDDRFGYLILSIGCFVIGWQSIAYLFSWFRSEFKQQVLVNPLYFLRFRFNRVEAIPFTGDKVWTVEHLKDTKGAYTGSKFYFRPETGRRKILKTTSIRTTNDLIEALNHFPEYVSGLVQRQDLSTLYFHDLLYEWRVQNEQRPQAARNNPTGLAFLLRKLGPALIASLLGVVIFFLAIVPYNDYRDDELRWGAAKSSATANGYRVYVASRPDGRHLTDAHAAIGTLYTHAVDKYRIASTSNVTSQGVEVVIKMLEYAKSTGHYKVFVSFVGDDQIPSDVETRLRRATGLSKLVPILPSFTPSMNQVREARILQEISESFGKVIPGDILQFSVGRGSPQEINFTVNYVIQATGDMYFPVSQEKLPTANRDFYTGIGFDWGFFVSVPDEESSRFQFSLKSEPAQLFKVAYTKSAGESSELVPTAVYGAMADSAFDDFGSKLLSQLAVK
jgi:tetratricopeptide (TPR) repeat protein